MDDEKDLYLLRYCIFIRTNAASSQGRLLVLFVGQFGYELGRPQDWNSLHKNISRTATCHTVTKSRWSVDCHGRGLTAVSVRDSVDTREKSRMPKFAVFSAGQKGGLMVTR